MTSTLGEDMRTIFQMLSIACLLSACATGNHAGTKVSLGETQCLLKDCRQFSVDISGRPLLAVGATFEIVDPKEYRGKSVVLFAGYDEERGQDLVLVPLGSRCSVDLSKADVVLHSDGSLEARAPFDFSYMPTPNQSAHPTLAKGQR